MAEENKIILDADVKPLKTQLKEATQALQIARQRYGEFSDEAVNAAKEVAGIRDSINAANEAAQLFDPGSRFQALTTAASTAVGGVAAVQGAMALFGGESEEVEKALLKVQGAMALSQGLSQLKDIGKVGEQLKITFRGVTAGMSNFRKALIATGVGALVAAVGLLIANFDTVKKVLNNLFPSLAKFASFIQGMVLAVTDFVGITNEAERSLEALGKANARSSEDIEARIKLLSAQGGKETEIYELRKQQTNEELGFLRESLKVKGELTDEELKRFRELKNNQIVEEATYQKQQEDAAKAAAEKGKAEREKQEAKEKEARDILNEARIKSLDKQQQEEENVEKNYAEKRKKLKEAGIKDDGTLEAARQKELEAIRESYRKEEEQKEEDFQKQLNEIRTATRLAGITDENEKARAQILLDYEKQREEVEQNEKLSSEQKTALRLELAQQEQQALDALQLTIEEAKLVKQLQDLDQESKDITTSFERRREIVEEQERINLELEGKTEEERTAIRKKASAERNAIDMAELQARADLQNKYLDLAGQFGNILQQLSGKNKKLAIAGVIIEQSAAIGKIIANTAVANAKSVAASPLTGGLPFTAINSISAGLSIASTIAGAVKAIQQINNPGGVSGGSIKSPAGISQSAPQVSSTEPTIGSSPITALGQSMQKQQPLRAYVVESEVTGTQRRVADIERRAGF